MKFRVWERTVPFSRNENWNSPAFTRPQRPPACPAIRPPAGRYTPLSSSRHSTIPGSRVALGLRGECETSGLSFVPREYAPRGAIAGPSVLAREATGPGGPGLVQGLLDSADVVVDSRLLLACFTIVVEQLIRPRRVSAAATGSQPATVRPPASSSRLVESRVQPRQSRGGEIIDRGQADREHFGEPPAEPVNVLQIRQRAGLQYLGVQHRAWHTAAPVRRPRKASCDVPPRAGPRHDSIASRVAPAAPLRAC